jgi:uncharacterized protein YegJ (DUF2314 family)
MADKDEIVGIPADDEEMLEAINARRSIKDFLGAFMSSKPNQKSFLLKVAFEDQVEVEHIWLADLELHSTPPTGVVANEQYLHGLKRVPFDPAGITDWKYLEDGALVGGFTTKVLKRRDRP